jgi:methylmalonyl-CoA mutase cobalamin-binding domain/chain
VVTQMGRGTTERLVSGSVKRPYRVVVAKSGLDGHHRGAEVMAGARCHAGFEVTYTGLPPTGAEAVRAVKW